MNEELEVDRILERWFGEDLDDQEDYVIAGLIRPLRELERRLRGLDVNPPR